MRYKHGVVGLLILLQCAFIVWLERGFLGVERDLLYDIFELTPHNADNAYCHNNNASLICKHHNQHNALGYSSFVSSFLNSEFLSQRRQHHNVDNTADETSATSSTSLTSSPLALFSLQSNPEELSAPRLPRVLAIYFPQYHKEPLNDKNWGENFTDWNSLQNAPQKNILGYDIPRPTEDLGYYNLNDLEPRQKQGELAKAHGIDGFIYHHYWFYDKSHPGPTLAQPLLNMLEDGHPNVPFFFNWCTVTWINVWMGRTIFQTVRTNKNNAIVLQEQYWNVSDSEIKVHYDWLAPFFRHNNYIRVDNQPVFLTYTYDERAIPILRKLRQYAIQDGFEGLHFIVGRSAPPDHIYQPPVNETKVKQERLMRTMGSLKSIGMDEVSYPKSVYNQTMNYPFPLKYITRRFTLPHQCLVMNERWPLASVGGRKRRAQVTGVITTFDNSPRRPDKEANIYNYGSKAQVLDRFRQNLFTAIYFQTCCTEQTQSEDSFVAINAWNEWGEGMAMEPSNVYGLGFLEVVQAVKEQVASFGCDGAKVPPTYRGNESSGYATADEMRANLVASTGWKKPTPRRKNRTKRLQNSSK